MRAALSRRNSYSSSSREGAAATSCSSTRAAASRRSSGGGPRSEKCPACPHSTRRADGNVSATSASSASASLDRWCVSSSARAKAVVIVPPAVSGAPRTSAVKQAFHAPPRLRSCSSRVTMSKWAKLSDATLPTQPAVGRAHRRVRDYSGADFLVMLQLLRNTCTHILGLAVQEANERS
mgnify:CR=1 FL=1